METENQIETESQYSNLGYDHPYYNMSTFTDINYVNQMGYLSLWLILFLCSSFCANNIKFICNQYCQEYKRKKYIQNKLITLKYEGGLFYDCSICLETFGLNEDIVKLNCNHCFHSNCIKLWINDNMNCPLCRQTIL